MMISDLAVGIVCSWCDLPAVYERRYLKRRRASDDMRRVVLACSRHAKQLLKVTPGYGYPIRRVDGVVINPIEIMAVFGVSLRTYDEAHSLR